MALTKAQVKAAEAAGFKAGLAANKADNFLHEAVNTLSSEEKLRLAEAFEAVADAELEIADEAASRWRDGDGKVDADNWYTQGADEAAEAMFDMAGDILKKLEASHNIAWHEIDPKLYDYAEVKGGPEGRVSAARLEKYIRGESRVMRTTAEKLRISAKSSYKKLATVLTKVAKDIKLLIAQQAS